MEYHVAISGNDTNPGTEKSPFRTIQHAADQAAPCDLVTVHEGIYKEKVDPPKGGDSDTQRITFRTAEGDDVSIKGSEVIKDWVRTGGEVWMVTLPNDYFGPFNPYANILSGDWFFPQGMVHHTGSVYINDQALNEGPSLESLYNGMGRKWFGTSDNDGTHIWVGCGNLDPNKELT